jgi:hypothetical protein
MFAEKDRMPPRCYRYEETTLITLDPSLSCVLLQKNLEMGGETRIFILGWFKRYYFNASWLPWHGMRWRIRKSLIPKILGNFENSEKITQISRDF